MNNFSNWIADASLKIRRFKIKMWNFLTIPSSSPAALIYAVITVVTVFISIASFVAETHPKFRVCLTMSLPINVSTSTLSKSLDSVYNTKLLRPLDLNTLLDKSAVQQEIVADSSKQAKSMTELFADKNNDSTEENSNNPFVMTEPWYGMEIIDYICLFFFSVDLLLRFYAAPNRCKFLKGIYTIVEIAAVLPYYMDLLLMMPITVQEIPPKADNYLGCPLFTSYFIDNKEIITTLNNVGYENINMESNKMTEPVFFGNRFYGMTELSRLRKKSMFTRFLKFIHTLRIFNIFRLFKVLRYYSGFQVLIYTLRSSIKDLLLMLTFISLATLTFASLIYFTDDSQVFTSIPRASWWAIVTITTVGYGDICPKTTFGFIIGTLCALVGVLMVAFTVPILVNTFVLCYSYADSLMALEHPSRAEKTDITVEKQTKDRFKDFRQNIVNSELFNTLNVSQRKNVSKDHRLHPTKLKMQMNLTKRFSTSQRGFNSGTPKIKGNRLQKCATINNPLNGSSYEIEKNEEIPNSTLEFIQKDD